MKARLGSYLHDLAPGDKYRSHVADRRITIVRKTPGAAKKALRNVAGDPGVSDQGSPEDALDGPAS